MNTTRTFRVLPFAGLAAAALVLSACGTDEPTTTTEPAAPATSAAAPATSAPATSAPASPSESASTAESSPSPSYKTTEVPENDVELDVDDQSGNGSRVVIQEVRMTGGTGFVAIYDRAGELLGSTKIGNDRGLTVDLDDKITETGEYTAVLFADEGDGTFDADEDLRVVEIDNDTDDDDDDDSNDVVDDDFDYTVR